MTTYVHIDGEVYPAEEASISVHDRGFLYGDGVFETIRVYGGRAFAWEDHMKRLDRSCEVIGLDHDTARELLRERMHETLDANGVEDAYVRISITRGVQPGRLTPSEEVDPTVVIYVESLPRGGVSGTPTWDTPAEATLSTVERIPNASIPAAAKTHNYLNGIIARLEARRAGVDEALMVDAAGGVTEGATSNVFLVVDGVLKTPTVDTSPVLPGITRKTVIELASDQSINVEETRIEPRELHRADEIFLTNTTSEVWPVVSIDASSYPIGPITRDVAAAFDAMIEEHHYS